MASLRERLATDLGTLVKEGRELVKDLLTEDHTKFRSNYQRWYTRALGAVRQLLPDRLQEFTQHYRIDRRKQMDVDTYGIHDFMLGLTFSRHGQSIDVKAIAVMRFQQQVEIVASGLSRLDDILSNIRGVVQAELLDSEIDSARELLKGNHLRAAGTVAGVVLERHLARVCESRGITAAKKAPTISDWNDKLKDAGVFDVPTWRGVQRLGDIRNLCCHPKERDPTKDEVDELIRGAERIVKTVV